MTIKYFPVANITIEHRINQAELYRNTFLGIFAWPANPLKRESVKEIDSPTIGNVIPTIKE